MGIDMRKGQKSKMIRPKLKEKDTYGVNLEKMDELVKTLFSVMAVNPNFFTLVFKDDAAKKFYRKENRHLLGIK